MSKKKQTPMDKLTKEYEEFIKGQELKKDGKKSFNKTLKKAAKPKQHGSK